MKPIRIAIIGEFEPAFYPHQKTNEALVHAAAGLDVTVFSDWVSTADIAASRLSDYDGFLVAPGSPYRSMEGALVAIRFAREERRPLLGTCGGFQHLIIEYARNVLGVTGADHEENDPSASELFISRLGCSLVGRTLTIRLTGDSRAAGLYGCTSVREEYYCQFGVNPAYVPALSSGPLRIVGSDDEGEVRVVELSDHPFFVGTLFVPQLRTSLESPHPLIIGLLASSATQQPNIRLQPTAPGAIASRRG